MPQYVPSSSLRQTFWPLRLTAVTSSDPSARTSRCGPVMSLKASTSTAKARTTEVRAWFEPTMTSRYARRVRRYGVATRRRRKARGAAWFLSARQGQRRGVDGDRGGSGLVDYARHRYHRGGGGRVCRAPVTGGVERLRGDGDRMRGRSHRLGKCRTAGTCPRDDPQLPRAAPCRSHEDRATTGVNHISSWHWDVSGLRRRPGDHRRWQDGCPPAHSAATGHDHTTEKQARARQPLPRLLRVHDSTTSLGSGVRAM